MPTDESGSGLQQEAAPEGGFLFGGRRVRLVDSITEAVGCAPGEIVVSGSHGGLSAARFALDARPHIVVFNDAGVGLDGAGIAALPWLQGHAIAALAVAHDSARIGQAASTWQDGVISHVNAAAMRLGARPGLALRDWLHPATRSAGLNGS